MVTEIYGHIIDEDRRKNAELMENAFYNKEALNPEMRNQGAVLPISRTKTLNRDRALHGLITMESIDNPISRNWC